MAEHHPAPLADAQALCERVVAAMYARDPASQAMGMRLGRVGPGRAELTMTVRADMLNGHAICHGYNLTTVASGCGIDFVAPAREGDLLTALAQERSVSGRTGVYDIEVKN